MSKTSKNKFNVGDLVYHINWNCLGLIIKLNHHAENFPYRCVLYTSDYSGTFIDTDNSYIIDAASKEAKKLLRLVK